MYPEDDILMGNKEVVKNAQRNPDMVCKLYDLQV